MKTGRLFRAIAVVATISLLVGAFIAPADARKKKRRKKKPPVVACASYVPWEKASSAPTAIVTDNNTAEAPLTAKVSTPQGFGSSTNEPEDAPTQGSPAHSWYNVQVDSASASGSYLYVRLEFPGNTDYDLYMRNPDGSSDTYAGGSPPYEGPVDGTGHGGHSEGDASGASENIDGMTVADCQGFSVDIVSATTPGGEVTLKFWLGPPPAS